MLFDTSRPLVNAHQHRHRQRSPSASARTHNLLISSLPAPRRAALRHPLDCTYFTPGNDPRILRTTDIALHPLPFIHLFIQLDSATSICYTPPAYLSTIPHPLPLILYVYSSTPSPPRPFPARPPAHPYSPPPVRVCVAALPAPPLPHRCAVPPVSHRRAVPPFLIFFFFWLFSLGVYTSRGTLDSFSFSSFFFCLEEVVVVRIEAKSNKRVFLYRVFFLPFFWLCGGEFMGIGWVV